jgi:hypothetical protein
LHGERIDDADQLVILRQPRQDERPLPMLAAVRGVEQFNERPFPLAAWAAADGTEIQIAAAELGNSK